MGMIKNYLLSIPESCSEHQFGQDAVEWAITSGLVRLSFKREPDLTVIMARYDEIIDLYRVHLAKTPDQIAA